MIYRDVTFSEFEISVKGKSIICVGAGENLNNIFKLWDSNITDKIKYIADNYKSGNKITHKNKIYDILKPEELLKQDIKSCVLLITTLYCKSVFEQLDFIFKDYDIECYISSVMARRFSNYKIEKSNSVQKIPKVIHYCWFGKSPIPEQYKECMKSWKKYCPDYEIIEWNEDNYDISKCKFMKQAYEAQKWGFVPDYARLDILYQYGGIYLDTDVELIRNLDDLLYEDAFVGFYKNFMVALGLGFGCCKGLDIFAEMRDFYDNIEFVNKTGNSNLNTCLFYQTKVLLKYGLKLNNEYQKVNKITVFPTDVLDPKSPSGKIILTTDNTYSMHHSGSSWTSNELYKKFLNMHSEVDCFLQRKENK